MLDLLTYRVKEIPMAKSQRRRQTTPCAQLPLFVPRTEAPKWHNLPVHTSAEIVRLMASLLLQLRHQRVVSREHGDE
jgi:hypothetical protein